jgi:hypothetical protein
MKKMLYTTLVALVLLQVSTSEAKGGLTGSDIKNPQQLQVQQGFAGDVSGDGGISQSVNQTSANTASSSSSLGFNANIGGGLGAGAGMAGLGGLGSMFGGNKAAAPASAPAAKPAASSTALVPFSDLD